MNVRFGHLALCSKSIIIPPVPSDRKVRPTSKRMMVDSRAELMVEQNRELWVDLCQLDNHADLKGGAQFLKTVRE